MVTKKIINLAPISRAVISSSLCMFSTSSAIKIGDTLTFYESAGNQIGMSGGTLTSSAVITKQDSALDMIDYEFSIVNSKYGGFWEDGSWQSAYQYGAKFSLRISSTTPANIHIRSSLLDSVEWIVQSENSIAFIGLEDSLKARFPIPIIDPSILDSASIFYISRITDTFGIGWWNGEGDGKVFLPYRWRFSSASDTVGEAYIDTTWQSNWISDRPAIEYSSLAAFGIERIYFGTGQGLCDTGESISYEALLRSTGFRNFSPANSIHKRNQSKRQLAASTLRFQVNGKNIKQYNAKSIHPRFDQNGKNSLFLLGNKQRNAKE